MNRHADKRYLFFQLALRERAQKCIGYRASSGKYELQTAFRGFKALVITRRLNEWHDVKLFSDQPILIPLRYEPLLYWISIKSGACYSIMFFLYRLKELRARRKTFEFEENMQLAIGL